MTTVPSTSVRRVRTPCAARVAQGPGGRMAVGVVGADRDHRQPRLDPVEQGAEAGVVAAVVGDLEHVDRAGVERNRLRLGVGGEQHREVVPAGEQDQRPAGWGRFRAEARRAARAAARGPRRRRPPGAQLAGPWLSSHRDGAGCPGARRAAGARAAHRRAWRPGGCRAALRCPPTWSDWSWLTTTAPRRSTPAARSLAREVVARAGRRRPGRRRRRPAGAGSRRPDRRRAPRSAARRSAPAARCRRPPPERERDQGQRRDDERGELARGGAGPCAAVSEPRRRRPSAAPRRAAARRRRRPSRSGASDDGPRAPGRRRPDRRGRDGRRPRPSSGARTRPRPGRCSRAAGR